MISLVFEDPHDYGKVTFDRDDNGVWLKVEVEDHNYNFYVELTEADRRVMIDWLEGVKE